MIGRRILSLQAALSVIARPIATGSGRGPQPPFDHHSLLHVSDLDPKSLQYLLHTGRLADLARRAGFVDVIRWVPKQRRDLDGSGIGVVLAETLFAIIGAVALQKGGAEAKKVARERILAVFHDRKTRYGSTASREGLTGSM